MKRFLITNPVFTGQAEVIYNAAGLLQMLDVSNTNMNEHMVRHFKTKIATKFSELPQSFGPETTIIEAAYEVSFEMFWKKYDKKINKSRCIILWSKMEKTMQVLAYFGIDAYNKFLKREVIRAKADPETYLRNKYWENEY